MVQQEKVYPRLVLRRIREKRYYLSIEDNVRTPDWEVCIVKFKGMKPHTVREGDRERMLGVVDDTLKFWKTQKRSGRWFQ